MDADPIRIGEGPIEMGRVAERMQRGKRIGARSPDEFRTAASTGTLHHNAAFIGPGHSTQRLEGLMPYEDGFLYIALTRHRPAPINIEGRRYRLIASPTDDTLYPLLTLYRTLDELLAAHPLEPRASLQWYPLESSPLARAIAPLLIPVAEQGGGWAFKVAAPGVVAGARCIDLTADPTRSGGLVVLEQARGRRPSISALVAVQKQAQERFNATLLPGWGMPPDPPSQAPDHSSPDTLGRMSPPPTRKEPPDQPDRERGR